MPQGAVVCCNDIAGRGRGVWTKRNAAGQEETGGECETRGNGPCATTGTEGAGNPEGHERQAGGGAYALVYCRGAVRALDAAGRSAGLHREVRGDAAATRQAARTQAGGWPGQQLLLRWQDDDGLR